MAVCITDVILATYKPFRTLRPRDMCRDVVPLNDSELAGAGSGTNTAVVFAGLSFVYVKDMFAAYGVRGMQGNVLLNPISNVLHNFTVMLSTNVLP